MDDKLLIAKAQAGEREALGELLMAHREPCYALALRLSGERADAEDVCQDAFLRASRDAASYRGESSFRSWLFGLVVHAYGDRLDSERARRRREEEHAMERSGAAGSAADSFERGELRRQLDGSLGRLDDRYRLPIILHYERGLSHGEVAAALALPEGTVKTNIHRGLEELRGLMTRAGYAAAAPTVVAALAEAPAVAVPASLTAFINGLATGSVAKAAAGAALKVSARLGAKKAAGLAFGWKVAAVVGVVAAGGVATPLVINSLSDKPAVAAPADDSDLAAAAARCRTVADLRALAPRVRAACEDTFREPDFDPARALGLEFAEFASRHAREDWQVPAPALAIRMALASPRREAAATAASRAWKDAVAGACRARHEGKYPEGLASLVAAYDVKVPIRQTRDVFPRLIFCVTEASFFYSEAPGACASWAPTLGPNSPLAPSAYGSILASCFGNNPERDKPEGRLGELAALWIFADAVEHEAPNHPLCSYARWNDVRFHDFELLPPGMREVAQALRARIAACRFSIQPPAK